MRAVGATKRKKHNSLIEARQIDRGRLYAAKCPGARCARPMMSQSMLVTVGLDERRKHSYIRSTGESESTEEKAEAAWPLGVAAGEGLAAFLR
jgi:hypothetical protein